MTQIEDSGLESSLLLTLHGASIATPRTSVLGTLLISSLSLSTDVLPADSAAERPSYLVISLNELEIVLERSHPITHSTSSEGERAYILHAYPPADVSTAGTSCDIINLRLPVPSESQIEEYEMLDAILSEYAGIQATEESPALGSRPPLALRESMSASKDKPDFPPQADELRGSLVLMDESSGKVLGQIPRDGNITEDSVLSKQPVPGAFETAQEKGDAPPVVVELPPDAYDAYTKGEKEGGDVDLSALANAREIFVRAVPPEEMDWITKGADLISRAIDNSTSLLVSGIASASSYYISHTKPGTSPQPPALLTAPATQMALRTAHTVSGHASRVSRQTVDFVESLLARAVAGTVQGGREAAKGVGNAVKEAGNVRAAMITESAEKAELEKDVVLEDPPPYEVYAGAKGKGRERLHEQEGGNAQEGQLGVKEKLALSANLLVAAVDDSAQRLWEAGSGSLAQVVGHKYGPDAAQSTSLATHTARNVVLVYVDMRGFARRALVRKAGTAYIKSKVAGKRPANAASVGISDQPAPAVKA